MSDTEQPEDNNWDNWDITSVQCDYEGCDREIVVCNCCVDKNNKKYYFKCDICRKLFCCKHPYYSYCTCPQSQYWNHVCRNCIPKRYDEFYRHTCDDDYGDEVYKCENWEKCRGLVSDSNSDIIDNMDKEEYRNYLQNGYNRRCNECKIVNL